MRPIGELRRRRSEARQRPTRMRDLTGWRLAVDQIYCYLTQFYVIAILAQVFLAGVGVFGDHASKVANASSFDPHRTLGTSLGYAASVLFLTTLLSRQSRTTVIQAFALAALTGAAQPALANAGDNSKWMGGFHALDGMLILLLSLWIAVRARRRSAGARLVGMRGEPFDR